MKFLKTLLFAFAVIFLIVAIAFLFVWLGSPKKDKQSTILVENKVPIEPYLFFENQEKQRRENPEKVLSGLDQNQEKTQEEEVKKPDTDSVLEENMLLKKKIEELEAKTKTPKTPQKIYTKEEVFLPTEQELSIKGKEESWKRRIANQKISILDKTKIVTDYGVGEIKGEDKVMASNEYRLFRTIISMTPIPIILREEINSTLSGSVTGIVRDNVYSYMGKAVLIPKGSIAEGIYEANNRVGEDRLQLIWTRIVTPQGVNIRFDGKTMDLTGGSGARGIVNNRYWDRYGFALTLNTLTSAGMIGISNLTQKVPNYNTQQILQQGVSDVSTINRAILQEQIKINPVITIKTGEIVFIKPSLDIFFPEPQEKEVMVQYFNRLKEIKQ